MTKVEINRLLDVYKDLFDVLKKRTAGVEYYSSSYEIIDETEPAEEWIITAPSSIYPGETYQYIPISILEALMDRVFSYNWQFEIVHHLLEKEEKTGIWLVNFDVKIHYRFPYENDWKFVCGAASSSAENICKMSMVSPMTMIEAKKSAIRQIGTLFGRNLNRGMNEAEGNAEKVSEADKKADQQIEKELAEFTQKVKDCEYAEDALRLIQNSPFKHNRELEKIALLKLSKYPPTQIKKS